MRNKYEGICYRCKKIVLAHAGHFEKIPYEERQIKKVWAKWRLQHAECAIKYRGTKKGKISMNNTERFLLNDNTYTKRRCLPKVT